MVLTTWATTLPPRAATSLAELASWLAVRAESAVWLTVPVSSAIEVATCCRLLAVCSVRVLRSVLPVAISCAATETPSAPPRMEPSVCRRDTCKACSALSTSEACDWPLASTSFVRSPLDRRCAWATQSPTKRRMADALLISSQPAMAVNAALLPMIAAWDQPAARPAMTQLCAAIRQPIIRPVPSWEEKRLSMVWVPGG